MIDDGDVRIVQGDALEQLALMPSESVHCIVTSPPFWALRDYGMGGQIGLEATPEAWCARLVDVFRECRRVLRADGVMWLECGDTYNGGGIGGGPSAKQESNGGTRADYRTLTTAPGLKPKDLVGAPWMLAFALRADGWYLRSDTIWARPNPMPESVTDRPTKSHSYVFLMSKSPRYYFDSDAIREPYIKDGRKVTTVTGTDASEQHRNGERWPNPVGANARSVWTIPTEPTPFAHFATFPQALVERCIKAGTSEHGCCSECGAPWVRVVEREGEWRAGHDRVTNGSPYRANPGGGLENGRTTRRETGWDPFCTHDAPVTSCTVLDPFMGSGTTALVARRLGRRAIGVELNPEYIQIAATRLQQLSLLGGAA